MLPPPCFTVWSSWRMNFCLFFKSSATSNMFSSWIVFYLNPSSYQLQLAFLSPRKKSMILRPQGSWWASLSNFSAINSFSLLAKMFSFGHSWQEDLLTQVCCLPNRKQSFSMLFFFSNSGFLLVTLPWSSVMWNGLWNSVYLREFSWIAMMR